MALPSPAAVTGYVSGTNNFDAAMKQLYRPSNVKKVTYEDRPFTAMVPKFEGFGGRNMPVVVKWGHPMGRSRSMTVAQAVASEVKADDFLLTRVSDYAINYIDAEALEATREDSYAFLKALSDVIDGTLEVLADSIETKLFRNGTGAICQLHASTAPTVANPMVLTLADAADIVNFEFNMELAACATDGGTVATTPASLTVAGVNRSAGTLTTDYDNSGAATNWAVSYYLACKGDLASSAGAQVCISGLEAWVPSSAPSSAAFFGVDRTGDSRLYGLAYDASGGGKLEDHFIKAQSEQALHGGKGKKLLLNHVQLRRLNIELGAKKTYGTVAARDSKGDMASIGFRSIVIEGDYGPIDVVACNKCRPRQAWLLTLEDWLLASLGPLTKIIVDDGLRMLRMADQDSFELRTRFRGNLCTKSPMRNTNITMPAPA